MYFMYFVIIFHKVVMMNVVHIWHYHRIQHVVRVFHGVPCKKMWNITSWLLSVFLFFSEQFLFLSLLEFACLLFVLYIADHYGKHFYVDINVLVGVDVEVYYRFHFKLNVI